MTPILTRPDADPDLHHCPAGIPLTQSPPRVSAPQEQSTPPCPRHPSQGPRTRGAVYTASLRLGRCGKWHPCAIPSGGPTEAGSFTGPLPGCRPHMWLLGPSPPFHFPPLMCPVGSLQPLLVPHVPWAHHRLSCCAGSFPRLPYPRSPDCLRLS